MDNAYQVLGRYYDRMIEYPYERVLDLALEKHHSGKALDLFCGTGRFSIMLARSGFTVEGSDLSPEMLGEAMTNSAKAGFKIIFKQENALEFRYNSPYDIITATSDGINYLQNNKIEPFFKRVYDALSLGGRFIFDMSSEYKLVNVLGNELYYEDYDDIVLFWQNSLRKKDKSVKMDLTFFEKNADGLYVRRDESQRQYAHSKEFIEQSALNVGFKIVKILDERFIKPRDKSERIIFVLEKE